MPITEKPRRSSRYAWRRCSVMRQSPLLSGLRMLAIAFLLMIPLLADSKTDDALAAALAQNKAQALTIAALTKAVASNAAHSDSATQQRNAETTLATTNAVAAQQAVSDQKETAARVEAKADSAASNAVAANSNADEAARAGDRNTNLIYLWGAMGIIVPAFLKYLSDGRMLRSQEAIAQLAANHQADVLGKLNKAAEDTAVLKNQTNGMTERLEKLATAAGHAQGVSDANSDAGRMGD